MGVRSRDPAVDGRVLGFRHYWGRYCLRLVLRALALNYKQIECEGFDALNQISADCTLRLSLLWILVRADDRSLVSELSSVFFDFFAMKGMLR